MKKISLLLALFVCIGINSLFAQNMQVTGTVTSGEDGAGIPGATVKVKGGTTGVVTDLDGKYSISVNPEATLVVSFVGLKTQEVAVAGQKVVNVTLQSDVVGLDEVVVTAIGVKRSEKSLGFSATTVSSDDITQSRTNSAMNALQGKVAGVNISSASGSPGSSTRVVVRGYSTIFGNTQPLYIVDGIPINNSSNNKVSDGNDASRTQDFGNGANDINPDDIESITILKGAAAALYGSRAANGVIVITTKKGKQSEKLNIEVSSSATFSDLLRVPLMQDEFGQGWNGIFKFEENGSWGPKLDGKQRLWGNVVDNQQRLKPFSSLESRFRDFYETGVSFNNTVAISGGNQNTNFYLSYGNVSDDGIVPTSADSYDRNSITMKGSAKGKRLTATGSFNYVNKTQSYVTAGQGSSDGGPTLYQDLLQIPVDISLVELKDYNGQFNSVDNYFTPYADNPYRILNENGNKWKEDRIIGSFSLDYKITDWLNATWRTGGDFANSHLQDWGAIAKTSPGSPNNVGGRKDVVGRVNEYSNHDQQLNSDFLLNANTNINDDVKLGFLLGYNVNQSSSRELYTFVTDLKVPNYYNIKNTSKSPTSETTEKEKRLFGYFGQADISYKDYAFFTVTARQDKSSTLPKGNNTFFYPSVSGSFIFSDAFPGIKDILPYGKLRASWTKIGNDASPYEIYSNFSPADVYASYGSNIFPLGGELGFEYSNRLENLRLKPELTTEIELGTDLRFIDNRIGVDFAVYKRTTNDLIIPIAVATSSGFRNQTLNVGTIENKGIELLFTLVPIKTKSFQWEVSANFSKNNNEVVKLSDEIKKIVINSAYDVDFVVKEGKPLGVFEGPDYARTSDGKVIVNEQGIPKIASENIEYGNAQSDYKLGLTNSFSYKGLTLNAAFDIRQGGLMYSYTSHLMSFVGTTTSSLYNDRQPFLVPNSVKEVIDSKGKTTYVENTTAIDMEHVCDYYNHNTNRALSRESVIDRSYIKLREVSLYYNIPKTLITKLSLSNVSVGVVGRNLILWTPANNTFVDPESTTFGNQLSAEFGEFGVGPSMRSLTFSLKINY